MPLFRKDRTSVLFVHVPKCGGTSITRAFRQRGFAVDYFDGRVGRETLNYFHHCTPQHWHADVLASILKLERITATFTFVRHPVTRLQSEYLWKHRDRPDLHLSPDVVEAWAVKAFARWRRGHTYVYDNHIRPQVEFLLPHARRFRVEDGVDTQLAELSRDHGLDLTFPLERAKESNDLSAGHRSADVPISDRLNDMIHDFYDDDFRVLGYS